MVPWLPCLICLEHNWLKESGCRGETAIQLTWPPSVLPVGRTSGNRKMWTGYCIRWAAGGPSSGALSPAVMVSLEQLL